MKFRKEWIGSIVFLLVAVLLVMLVGERIYTIAESRGWPRATAHIVSSKVIEDDHGAGSTSNLLWRLKLSYRYKVKGNTYIGWRYTAFGDTEDKSYARIEALASSYRSGKVVPVFYDPSDPSSSLLLKGTDKDLWINLGGYGGMELFLLVGAFAFWRSGSSDEGS